MRNYRIDHEAGAQEALFSWCDMQRGKYPELRLLYHVPNGGKRDAATARALKRQGVKAGVPDLCLPVARDGWHGLYIELKVGSNKPTELQKQWLKSLRQQDYATAVCYGWEEAADVLKSYLDDSVLLETAATAAAVADMPTMQPAT